MIPKPTFAQWKEQMGLSIEEVAALLGLGRSQVCLLLRGSDSAGRPAVPRQGTRMLMSAATAGISLKPWALSAIEVANLKAVRRRRIAAHSRNKFEVAA
jgi:hypothetical protein